MTHTRNNLVENIFQQSKFSDDDIAIVEDGCHLTFSLLKNRVYRFAGIMKKNGIQPEERVLLLLDDSSFFFVAFLGLIYMGAIPVALNPRTKDFKHFLNDSGCVAVILDDHSFKLNQSFLPKNLSCFINSVNNQENTTRLDFNIIDDAPYGSCLAVTPQSPAFWQYTSGTTGLPKAVVHHHAGMLANCELFSEYSLSIKPGDRIYSVAKMFFGYGLGNSLFFTIYNGAVAILDKQWPSTERIRYILEKYKPTIFFAGPKIYHMILNDKEKFVELLPTVKTFFSAGSFLPESIFNQWHRIFNSNIYDGVGCTEMGHVYLSNIMNPKAPVSANQMIPGYEAKLIKTNKMDINISVPIKNNKHDAIGEMWIKGPSQFLGYWKNGSIDTSEIKNGWHNTKDYFLRIEEKNYIYHGRSNDLFKINGRWVVPKLIEEKILNRFSDVSEAAIVSYSDKTELTACCLCVVHQHSTTNDIESYLVQNIESYMQPKFILSMHELPKNCNGKIDKSALSLIVKEHLSQEIVV
ncbi:AMP-binding protein [Aliikangiella sp. IMCC44359]|uniref:AMP-binding protein n=1 Tax=Aliikangiella sp. IMCC44359 TaxID=3459125 RepID=UPI00403AAAAE